MKNVRIGYLPDSEEAAERLREGGYDVSKYDNNAIFDVLLYGGSLDSDPITGMNPMAPLFLLNTKGMSEDELRRQLQDRTYSRLFE